MANDKGNVYLIAEAYNSESALEEVKPILKFSFMRNLVTGHMMKVYGQKK